MLSTIKTTVTALAALYLTACTVVPGVRVDIDEDEQIGGGYRVIPVNESTVDVLKAASQIPLDPAVEDLPRMSLTKTVRDYQLGPGDVLTIIVWDHPELNNPFGAGGRPQESGIEVNPSGAIFYPYCGVIRVQEATTEQVREELTKCLAGFLNRPQVDVRVAAYRSQRVQVAGEVANPGVVNLDNTEKGVLEAIGERGGISQNGSRRKVVLMRDGKRIDLSFDALFGKAGRQVNPLLMPGDVIQVPDTSEDQVVVMGEVVQNGRSNPLVPMGNGNMTALEAVAAAGGMSQNTADGSGLIVFRQPNDPASPASVFVLDLATPKGVVLASHFQLAPRDIVYVKATGMAQYNAVISQILPSVQTVFFTYRVLSGR